MSKTLWVALLTCAVVAGAGYAAEFSTGFEYVDLAEMTADGWTWGANTPNLNTDPAFVRSGQQSLRLYPRVLLERPLGEFGTLNLWVYDAGMIDAGNVNGPRWGVSKNGECLAAHFWNRSFLPSANGYAANPGQSASPKEGDQWFSSCFVAGGSTVPGEHLRGAVGWMNWEIAYYPDGLIEINLLDDPNGFGPKAFNGNTVGTPVAPGWTWGESIQFLDPSNGGVEAIYLMGSWDAAEPFGPLYVDDLTWTPAGDLPPCIPGDADCDGDVDLDDFVALKVGFGTGTTWAEGDFDEDGDVDLDDFVILKTNFGATAN